MAKNKKNKSSEELDEELELENDSNEGSSKGSSKKGKFIGAIIFALILAILVAILGFNAGGIRDKYLRKPLEKIPIIKNLLPPIKKDESIEEEISEDEKAINSLTEEIKNLKTEIDRLKTFELSQNQFKIDKEKFDKLIALNDPKAYSTFYESISPENAEKLYKEAVVKANLDKDFKEYISTFENMKKDAASKILEELILTDTDLVITILENLTSVKRAEILSTMDSKNAATATKLLSVDNSETTT